MVKLSFYLLMASSAYIFLKRFYLHEILNFAIWIACGLFTYLNFGLHNLLTLLNVTPAELLINFDCC